MRIKVEYDRYNRAFKLLDREFGCVLEDGGEYELLVPFMLEDESAGENGLLDSIDLAHA